MLMYCSLPQSVYSLNCCALMAQVGSVEVSPDHKLLAWTEDTKGGEKYTLHVKVCDTPHWQQHRGTQQSCLTV